MKDAASQILSPHGGLNNTQVVQDDDYWNKIIMFNVDQFHREQEEAKQRQKENQIRMKEELEKQVQN
jgi:hypothetical protein